MAFVMPVELAVVRLVPAILPILLLACDASDTEQTATGHLRGVRDVEVTVTRVDVDERAMSHTRLQQTIAGVAVFGAEAIVHLHADGSLRGITDNLIDAPAALDPVPALTAEEAIQQAVAGSLGWVGLTEAPEAELVFLPRDGQVRLAWRVQLSRVDGTGETARPMIFICARAGEVLWQYDNFQTGAASGIGTSSYSGTVSLETFESGGLYYLEDTTRALGTYTFENTEQDLYYLEDGNNQWDEESKREGVDVHYAGAGALDFYQDVFSRDGIDGSGGPGYIDSLTGSGPVMTMLVNYGEGYVNAGWTGEVMVFGDGDGYYSSALTTVDVVGHELTHGVVEFTAGLIYADESGALNESYADVMGVMIERYLEGEHAGTWQVGEDCFTPHIDGDALRYMDDPTADGISSDHYSSRYTGSEDDGGVHLNSGIGNLAFYLTSEGGQHPTRGGEPVEGIGMDAAADIWYRALTRYMTASSDFAGARKAMLHAAEDLYGADSLEYATIQDAWNRVGVGEAAPEQEEPEEETEETGEETEEAEDTGGEETGGDADEEEGDDGEEPAARPPGSGDSAGCSTVSGSASWLGILAAAMLGWRRRD